MNGFIIFQGSPTDVGCLRKAKIENSQAVLLFAAEGIANPDLVDGKTF